LFLSAACSSHLPNLEQLSPIPQDVCRVVVLPFLNESDYMDGQLLLYRVFVSELVRSGNFILPLEGDVRKTFREIGLPYTEKMDLNQIRMIADRLDVDLVISGQIVEMEATQKGSNAVNPLLAVYFQIFSPDSGMIIWTTYHRREGLYYQKVMHFGVVNTITELARIISIEVMDQWYKNGLTPCEN